MFVTQRFARTVDGDGLAVNNIDNEGQTSFNYIVITHEPMLISESPVISIDNSIYENFGTIGSGADFEIKRVSATQTVILNTKNLNTYVEYVVEGALPVGSGVIEESFIIQ